MDQGRHGGVAPHPGVTIYERNIARILRIDDAKGACFKLWRRRHYCDESVTLKICQGGPVWELPNLSNRAPISVSHLKREFSGFPSSENQPSIAAMSASRAIPRLYGFKYGA